MQENLGLCYVTGMSRRLGRKFAGRPVKVLFARGAKKFGQRIVSPQRNYEESLHLCVACVGFAWQKNVIQRAFTPRRPVLDFFVCVGTSFLLLFRCVNLKRVTGKPPEVMETLNKPGSQMSTLCEKQLDFEIFPACAGEGNDFHTGSRQAQTNPNR